MNNRWTQTKPSTNTRVEPWVLFGGALIVTVAAILFAIGTWLVRSGQAQAAMDQATRISVELNQANEDTAKFKDHSEDLQKRVDELLASEVSLKEENRKVQAELESKKREADGVKSTAEDIRRKDVNPELLPPATLRQILGNKPVVDLRVYVDDPDHQVGFSNGELSEHLKQKCRDRTAIEFADTGKTMLLLNVTSTTLDLSGSLQGSTLKIASLSVLLELQQDWKVPGTAFRQRVTIWRRVSAGLTTGERAKSVTEQLIDQEIDELANDVAK